MTRPLRRSDDLQTGRAKLANAALVFSIVLCIGAAITLKLTSKDSNLVDILFGIFMLLAVGLAIPVRFRGFISTVGEYIPRIGSPAARAVAASDQAVAASQKAAIAVREAVDPSKADPEQPE